MNNSRSNVTPTVGSNWLEVVRQHVESLRFGAVEIIVHDSRVIQIETTERVRFDKTGTAQSDDTGRTSADTKTPPAKQ